MSTEPWRFSKRGELLPPACLNCQAVMIELFCAKCGQKNEVPNRALWPLLKDSIGLFLVADGKLWRTLHLLLFKPGELAVQYVAGRRAAYVKPFTMYFWVSALVLTSMLFDWSELSFGPPRTGTSNRSSGALSKAGGAGRVGRVRVAGRARVSLAGVGEPKFDARRRLALAVEAS